MNLDDYEKDDMVDYFSDKLKQHVDAEIIDPMGNIAYIKYTYQESNTTKTSSVIVGCHNILAFRSKTDKLHVKIGDYYKSLHNNLKNMRR